MADNTIVIVGIIAVVLIMSGIVIVPGINAPADAEFGLNLGSEPDVPDVPDNVDIEEAQSSLAIGTGYIDSEGNLITPSDAVAQSVYWAGTTDIVADVAVNPVLSVVHSDEVLELSQVAFDVSFPKVEASVEGSANPSFVTYENGVTVHTGVLPADGGQLGSVTILGDIMGMSIDVTTGSDQLEAFLWSAIDEMGLQVSDTYVDEGTFIVHIVMYVQIDNIIIDYKRSGLDGGDLTGQYISPASFVTPIPLDLEFVVGAPAVTSITWEGVSSVPDARYPLIVGRNLIDFLFKPRTTGTPDNYEFTVDSGMGETLLESGDWDGNDIAISISYDITVSIEDYKFKLVVWTVDGISSYKTITFMFTSTTGGDPPEGTSDITDLDLTFSTFMPASLTGSGSTSLILVGAGFFVLLIGWYWYKKYGIGNYKGKRLRGLRR